MENTRLAVGDRVRLSEEGKRHTHIFPRGESHGVVVLPGRTRGGLYLRVLQDGEDAPETFAAKYWELEGK